MTRIGYFVVNQRTFWRTFYRPKECGGVPQLPIIRFVHHLEYVVSEGELESELAVCTTKPMNEAEPRLCFDL